MSGALVAALETEVEKLRGDLIEAKGMLAECQARLAALEAKERQRDDPYPHPPLRDYSNAGGSLPGPWGRLAGHLTIDGA